MVQESYADFSIIQKYLDQKRYFDEEIKSYKDKITALESTINELKYALDAKDQAISQYHSQLEDGKIQLRKKEKSFQELSTQVYRLKKQLELSQRTQKSQAFDENLAKKTKFGFLKK